MRHPLLKSHSAALKEQMRNKFTHMFLSGPTKTFLQLWVSRTAVRTITHKCGGLLTLPSDQPTNRTLRTQRGLMQEVIKEAQQHVKNCRPLLTQFRSEFMFQQEEGDKMDPWESSRRKTPLSNKNVKNHLKLLDKCLVD